MSKAIALGNLSGASGTITHQVGGYAASKYSLFVDGAFDGGTLALKGGDGTNFEAIMLTDVILGGHTAFTITVNPGLFTFDLVSDFFQIVLSGAGAADIDFTLFPEPRH